MERQNSVVQTSVAVSRVRIPAMLQTAAAPATSATPRQRRLAAPGSMAISCMTINLRRWRSPSGMSNGLRERRVILAPANPECQSARPCRNPARARGQPRPLSVAV